MVVPLWSWKLQFVVAVGVVDAFVAGAGFVGAGATKQVFWWPKAGSVMLKVEGRHTNDPVPRIFTKVLPLATP